MEDGHTQGNDARDNGMLMWDKYRCVLGGFDTEYVAERVFRENISCKEIRIVCRRQNV